MAQAKRRRGGEGLSSQIHDLCVQNEFTEIERHASKPETEVERSRDSGGGREEQQRHTCTCNLCVSRSLLHLVPHRHTYTYPSGIAWANLMRRPVMVRRKKMMPSMNTAAIAVLH